MPRGLPPTWPGSSEQARRDARFAPDVNQAVLPGQGGAPVHRRPRLGARRLEDGMLEPEQVTLATEQRLKLVEHTGQRLIVAGRPARSHGPLPVIQRTIESQRVGRDDGQAREQIRRSRLVAEQLRQPQAPDQVGLTRAAYLSTSIAPAVGDAVASWHCLGQEPALARCDSPCSHVSPAMPGRACQRGKNRSTSGCGRKTLGGRDGD